MPSRRHFLMLALAAPATAGLLRPAVAATPRTYAEGGVAIDGTDPVGYFLEGRPVPGDPAHPLEWRGAVWHFASPENRARFEANPVAYAPKYGGYCAYAASQGYIATTVPDAWTIHDGQLYLNYSRRVRRLWLRDLETHIRQGDANWPAILSG